MGSRVSPEDNRVPLLLKIQQIADKISPIPISTAGDVPEVKRKKFPVNLSAGSKLGVRVRPRGELMDVVEPAVAEASNRAVQMAIGYRVGGGKMRFVIPKKRKLVKTMMYHSIKDFVISLFCTPPSAGAGTGALP